MALGLVFSQLWAAGGAALAETSAPVGLAMDVRVMLTPSCIFSLAILCTAAERARVLSLSDYASVLLFIWRFVWG
jgi:hypothetical protein